MTYAVCIAFYKRYRNRKARMYYNYDAELFDNYDFRAHSNWLQLIVSNFYVYNGILGCIYVTFAYIIPWIISAIIWLKTAFLSNVLPHL